MSRSRTAFTLGLILIIASFLRLYHLKTTPPGLYPDEAMDGTNAQETLQTGHFKVYYPENNGREGLFMNMQAVFLKVIGQNEPWVLRLPSAIFGILTVLGMFSLTRELFRYEIPMSTNIRKQPEDSYIRKKFIFRSEHIALLSAFLLATSFWHINFSRISFRAITAPFFLVWAIYFLLLGFNKLARGEKFRYATLFHIIGGIFFGLGFYTYIAYRVMPLLVLFVIIYFWRIANRNGWVKNFLHSAAHFLFFTFIVALPIGWYYLKHPADFLGRTAQVSIFSSPSPIKALAWNTVKTLGMFNVRGDYNWRHNISGAPELFWPVGILFLIGIILGIRSIFATKYEKHTNIRKTENGFCTFVKNLYFVAENKFGFWVLFLWFALALLPVVISNEGIPHALRSILLIPPAIMFAAIGGMWFYEFLSTKIRKPILFSIFYFLFSIIAVQAYYAYFISWAQNPNVPGAFATNYAELGHALNALPNNIPKYVVVKTGGVLVNGIPMPAQTVMFITNTYTKQGQAAKNIHYVLPDEENKIPAGAMKFYLN